MSSDSATVTQLLHEIRDGQADAMDKLLPVVYSSLKRVARSQLRNWPGNETMNTTGLVHEAYMKLVGKDDVSFENRGHFFSVAAKAMRQVMIDAARNRSRLKRGGGKRPESIDDGMVLSEQRAEDLIALEEALCLLEKDNPARGQVVECRFFAGFTAAETAEIMGISRSTVTREWEVAKAWLFKTMKE